MKNITQIILFAFVEINCQCPVLVLAPLFEELTFYNIRTSCSNHFNCYRNSKNINYQRAYIFLVKYLLTRLFRSKIIFFQTYIETLFKYTALVNYENSSFVSIW